MFANLAQIFQKDWYYLRNQKFLWTFFLSLVLLILSLLINFYAGQYATLRASNAVNDIVLDNIPVFNVDDIFVYGPTVFFIIIVGLLLEEPKRAPFVLKSIALFILIRSAFITLTHIGPYPYRSVVDYTSNFVKDFTFGGDLFFSAHTGLPFLMALVFQRNKHLLFFFTAVASFFGTIVLLGHLHYTIDVLSAFFITYTIYSLARWFFKQDDYLFNHGLPE